MTVFKKEDMQNGYYWADDGGDNVKLTGEPDASQLDRNEGHEVLYIIQKLMKGWNLSQISTGHKIEKMIKNAPEDLRSQLEVKDWISNNWKPA